MRIRELHLQTSVLSKLKQFYTEKLELPLHFEKKNTFEIQAGSTIIKFTKAPKGVQPFYHFAFNIPENKIPEALEWLKSRVKLISIDNKQIVNFETWNADSIYFFDPAGNILEFIARHNLRNKTSKPFDSKMILCVSEIGHPVENVRLFSEHIRAELNIKLWDGDEEKFAAVGDEQGLFIIVPIDRPWFPLDKPAEDHPISVNVG